MPTGLPRPLPTAWQGIRLAYLLAAFHWHGRTLAAGEHFHGFLTNYRADGTKYRVRIDCRPLRDVTHGRYHASN